MTRVVVAAFVAALSFGWSQPAVGRWQSERDNKSRAELEQLDERGLFQEAFDVCVRRAVLLTGQPTPNVESVLAAADDYLALIESAARARTGVVPGWLREFSFARTTKDCQEVFRAFVSGETAPETRPAAESLPGEGSRVSKPPRKGAAVAPPAQPTVGPVKSTPTRTPVIRVPGFPVLWYTPTPFRERATPTVKASGSSRAKNQKTAPLRKRPQPADKTPGPKGLTRSPQEDEVTDELPPWFR